MTTAIKLILVSTLSMCASLIAQEQHSKVPIVSFKGIEWGTQESVLLERLSNSNYQIDSSVKTDNYESIRMYLVRNETMFGLVGSLIYHVVDHKVSGGAWMCSLWDAGGTSDERLESIIRKIYLSLEGKYGSPSYCTINMEVQPIVAIDKIIERYGWREREVVMKWEDKEDNVLVMQMDMEGLLTVRYFWHVLREKLVKRSMEDY